MSFLSQDDQVNRNLDTYVHISEYVLNSSPTSSILDVPEFQLMSHLQFHQVAVSSSVPSLGDIQFVILSDTPSSVPIHSFI